MTPEIATSIAVETLERAMPGDWMVDYNVFQDATHFGVGTADRRMDPPLVLIPKDGSSPTILWGTRGVFRRADMTLIQVSDEG